MKIVALKQRKPSEISAERREEALAEILTRGLAGIRSAADTLLRLVGADQDFQFEINLVKRKK